MTELSAAALLDLANRRTGHFAMESGLHSALWLDLSALFASAAHIQPFVAALADRLRTFEPDVICGPLVGGAFLAQSIAQRTGAEFWFAEPAATADGEGLFHARYRVPTAFANRRSNPRVALVDDVMSAGSSLRATYAALRARAQVVAVGALMQLGDVGAEYFAAERIPIASLFRQAFEIWTPEACPLCAAGEPLEQIAPATP